MENSNKRNLLRSDRIGALPDVVLHHIFSFLDMNEVVQTSLLSSRWRYLWVSLPFINCDNFIWKSKNYRSAFNDFVDNVLLLRDGSDITKFKIYPYYYDSKRVGVWITSAVRRHLKEMHLRFRPDRQIELPQALFSSGITVLELILPSTGGSSIRLKIPNLICSMTRLTTLKLTCVELPVGNSSGELLFNYPVLENLKLIDCGHDHIKVLNISSPQLKTFAIQNDFRTTSTYQMELCAPSLQLLEARYYGSSMLLENIRMRNLSSLVNAKFRLDDDAVALKDIVKLLEVCSCVKTIDLTCRVLFTGCSSKLLASGPFLNLRCFKLTGTIADSWCISFILKMFPCMETLVLHYGFRLSEDLFPSVNHLLKYVEIGWLNGDEADYDYVKTLLENGSVLEKLVIRMNKDLSSSVRETFGKKILSLFKPSSSKAIFLF